jgi:hypothetical protein
MKMRGNTLVWIATRSLAAIAVVFALSEPADACDCGVPGPCQALSFADAVFTGVVTDISPVLTPDGNGVTGFVTTLAADRSFVGRTGTGTVILTAKLSSCDFQFRVGERYLVYARRASDGSLIASSCSRTKLLTDADEDLAFLTSLSPIGTGGQLSGLVERVQIDLLGVHHGENLTAAAPGVSLTITGPQEVRRDVVTDGDGRFHAAGLPAGNYRIAVNVPQTIRVQGELEVRLADRGCAVSGIHLIANGRVSGRVIDRLGDAVPRAAISLMPAAFTNRDEFPHVWIRAQASDARGEFAFDGLPAGEYHLGVNVMFGASPSSPYAPVWLPGVDARAETVPVRLSEGGRRSGLEIVLGDRLRETVIQGIVLLADGSAASGAQVALLSPGSRIATAINRADGTGAFELKALEKTAYVLEASLTGPSGKRMSATASVDPTAHEPVFLRMVLADVATPSNRHQR